jgi:pimeloyl-ACP methyl ester carboxylesterase
VFHCTRAVRCAGALLVLAVAAQEARAQTQPAREVADFTIYLQGRPIGTEQVTVARSAGGIDVSSIGRTGAPIDIVLRQLTTRYDPNWHPIELSIDATVNGHVSRLHSTIDGSSVTTDIVTEGTAPFHRIEAIDPEALLLPSPFIAPYESIAARLANAAEGAALVLYQPGQGPFSARVGQPVPEQIQTVERIINARRTQLTFQVPAQSPIETEVWADESGRLLRLRIPSQQLEVARTDMSAVSTRRLTMSRPNDEDVRIAANGFSLAGTLSRPQGKSGPLPAVILVGGSGPTDRDENLFGIPIFGEIAKALADSGFAVLRYDKRGVGQSGGRPESAALADYADDLRAVIKFMNDRKDIDRRRIALLGHSEGGAVALLAATKEKRLAGLVLVSTLGTTGAELNMYQVTHALDQSNRSPAERQATIELQRQIQQAVMTGKGWESISIPVTVRRQAETPWFQSYLNYDPARVMKDVSQPILIVQGQLDSQVPPDNADRLEMLARQRRSAPPVELVKVPGVNHLLVPANTGEVDEYGKLGNVNVSPDVLNAITSWLTKTMAPPRQ